jgi:hypothetical protein
MVVFKNRTSSAAEGMLCPLLVLLEWSSVAQKDKRRFVYFIEESSRSHCFENQQGTERIILRLSCISCISVTWIGETA